ncbi:tol-pal system protein YbgF [Kaarinaea lacus]
MKKLLRHIKLICHGLCVAFVFAGFVFAGAANAAAPVVDSTVQNSKVRDLENRMRRVESRLNNQGLVDLMQRFDQIQRDMQRLIGDIEVQSHELKRMKDQQKKLYSDIDHRLRKLEQSGVANSPAVGGAPGSPVPVAPAAGLSAGSQSTASTLQTAPVQPAAPPPSQMSEVERNVARSAYERAFNLLKQGRYELAIPSFKAFLDTYPDAPYADNAQYWLGEANYAQKRYKSALKEFQKVIDQYPNSPKRADAMLKIGYTHDELGNKKLAMQALNSIVTTYPNSTAARLAQKRMKNLKSSR